MHIDSSVLSGLPHEQHDRFVRNANEIVIESFIFTGDRDYGFWHLISEAPEQDNRNEDDRIPDLRRCERVRWVAWCIQNAGTPGFSWWENDRKGQTHVVIWAEEHDYAVMLGMRNTAEGVRFYLLKTAYCTVHIG